MSVRMRTKHLLIVLTQKPGYVLNTALFVLAIVTV